MEREFGLVVHDVESAAVTLAWNTYKDGAKYEIEIEGSDGTTLKNTISSTMMRKKNLTPASVYTVKVRATTDEETWTPFCPAVEFTTLSEGAKRMAAPTVLSSEESAATMQWEKGEGGAGCYFRVRPKTIRAQDATGGGSGSVLMRPDGSSVPLASLAGKAVGLYCSASWCPPCKQYTPMLATFYTQMKGDKDEASFRGYHAKMPWLAVPFGSPARESALATLKVQGIPMLTVLSPSGAIVEQNAVQTPLNPATLDRWLR